MWCARALTPSAPLESLADVCPSARWYERELAEMFGVTVVGAIRAACFCIGYPTMWQPPCDARSRSGSARRAPGPAQRARRSKVPGVHPEWQEQ